MPRKVAKLEVPPEDRRELERRVASRGSKRSAAWRAQVVLMGSDERSIAEIMEATGLSRHSVHLWKRRYAAEGLAGLEDKDRPGRPVSLPPEKTRKILKMTAEGLPIESTHWSVRLMAKYARTTTWQVRQVWKSADMKPHLVSRFKLSQDPQFAEKVIDVVGLYVDPPDNAVVLSVDEKTQIQALDRTQPMLPLRSGKKATQTHDYVRHGTTSLYAAFDIATGRVIGRVTQKHRAREFLGFLRQIDDATPADIDLHLILDNSSTHKTADVRRWLEAHPRFHVHFTPTSASWLNAVEGWFAQLERRAVRRGTFSSVNALREELKRYIEAHNAYAAKPFRWTQPADAILASVAEARKALVRQ